MKRLLKELQDLRIYGQKVLSEDLYSIYLEYLLQESLKRNLSEENAKDYLDFVNELIGKLYKNGKKVKIDDRVADKANDLRFNKVTSNENMLNDYFENKTLGEFEKEFEDRLKRYLKGSGENLTSEEKGDIRVLYQDYIDRFDTDKFGTGAKYYKTVKWKGKPNLYTRKK